MGIKVFSLCIQTNSLLSLSEFDLGTSFGNLMYSGMCMVILGTQLVTVAVKVSCKCVVVIVFNVKYVALESINDSISCLSYIFNIAPVAFQFQVQFRKQRIFISASPCTVYILH